MGHRHHLVAGVLSALVVVGLGIGGAACGTGAAPAGGDQNLPNARVGPFRVLRTGETTRKAPFVFESGLWRDPAIVALGEGPEAGATRARLFLAGGGANNGFLAFTDLAQAVDRGNGVPTRVLEAAEEWEAGALGAPSVLVDQEKWLLFYAAGGCIGRAVSTDGEHFERAPRTPVLCGDERGPVGAPSIARGGDGGFRLFYEQAGAILEARALDAEGSAFGAGETVLRASTEEGSYDAGGVGDPCALPLTAAAASVTGRTVRYLYYTAHTADGTPAIGLAARFGDDGPLERAREPVLTRYRAHAPTALVLPTMTLLYASSSRDELGNDDPAVLAGLAPATVERPLPSASAPSGASGDSPGP